MISILLLIYFIIGLIASLTISVDVWMTKKVTLFQMIGIVLFFPIFICVMIIGLICETMGYLKKNWDKIYRKIRKLDRDMINFNKGDK